MQGWNLKRYERERRKMNRPVFYNYIEERLTVLALRIERRGKINILDYHLHSENFYRDFFNLLYGWELENLNENQQNVEAIDLIDNKNKIIIQVSATNTKSKIDSAIQKESLKNYEGYTFKFISIARSSNKLRNKNYPIPNNLFFNPQNDIYDTDSILREILGLSTDRLRKIYDFIKSELGIESSTLKLKSSLTKIINILAEKDLSSVELSDNLNSFDIGRKIVFNKLDSSRLRIQDFMMYQKTVGDIYASYDKMGQNKSLSVLNTFRKEYIDNFRRFDGDELYETITDNIIEQIKKSANFGDLSTEELRMYVDILMVDAFIRCKIFENPNNYNYVTS